jgi:hypothetical protein
VSRGRLPVRSAHWIPYWTALQDAIARFGSERLAIKQLDDALASGTIRCKIESARNGSKPVLVKGANRVAAVFLPDELCDPWVERPNVYLNDRPREGWLFLWNYDRIKYFDESADWVPPKAVEVQETPAAVGRPPVHDWIRITLIAEQLRRNCPTIKPTRLISKIQDRLEAEGKKAPVLSALQPLVGKVFAFDNKH